MSDAELTTEWEYRVAERLGALRDSGAPPAPKTPITKEMKAIAIREADAWMEEQNV